MNTDENSMIQDFMEYIGLVTGVILRWPITYAVPIGIAVGTLWRDGHHGLGIVMWASYWPIGFFVSKHNQYEKELAAKATGGGS